MLPDIPAEPGDICLYGNEWWHYPTPIWVLLVKENKKTLTIRTERYEHLVRRSRGNEPHGKIIPVPDCLVPPKVLQQFEEVRKEYGLRPPNRPGMRTQDVIDHVLKFPG